MKIAWQAVLETGHSEIDANHKEMFQKINELIIACKEKREKPVVIDHLTFLHKYVHRHFAVEERYMVEHCIPNQDEHLRQHEQLRNNLEILMQECLSSGANLSVVANTLKLTYLWLKDHIQLMDKRMVAQ